MAIKVNTEELTPSSTSIMLEATCDTQNPVSTSSTLTQWYTSILIVPGVTITCVNMLAVGNPTYCYAPPLPTSDLTKIAAGEEDTALCSSETVVQRRTTPARGLTRGSSSLTVGGTQFPNSKLLWCMPATKFYFIRTGSQSRVETATGKSRSRCRVFGNQSWFLSKSSNATQKSTSLIILT